MERKRKNSHFKEMRNQRENKTVDHDLSKPLPPIKTDDSCFGKEWDLATNDCQYCADNEVCGILFSKLVKAKVETIEADKIFLDQTDFTLINKKELLKAINGMSTGHLMKYIQLTTKSTDEVAIVEWIKRFVKETEGLSIKGGICHYGN
jgi:hypothetical protein